MHLLETNGKCELPCFLGLTPGITTWSEASELFSYLGKNVPEPRRYDAYDVETYTYQYHLENQQTIFGIGFYVVDDQITMLYTKIDQMSNNEVESHYSLKNVISSLGPPTNIFIELYFGALGPEDSAGYKLTLYYDQDDYW